MKIIVAHASAGSGHRRAAEAIYNYFKKNYPSWETELIDTLQKSTPAFRNIYVYGYDFLVNHALWLWQLGFSLTASRLLKPLVGPISSFLRRLNTGEFARYLIRQNPDWVISTHFLPSEITAQLKRQGKLCSRLLTVVTDFGVHPFWIAEGTDSYAAASEFTGEELRCQGVAEDKIMVTGIPIEERFSLQYDKNRLCGKFGIEADKFTILIVTGSFGIGGIEDAVSQLQGQAQLLVVCAKNQRLYAKLTQKAYPGVKVFGFVGNIEEMMAVSDLIITKPGGLTVSESLAMEVVPLFIAAIPGQETRNADILAGHGIGVRVSKMSALKGIVADFQAHPDKIKAMQGLIAKIKKPHAAEEISHVICKGSTGLAA